MRLFLLTALTMVAFAANSILNRLALAGGHIDAVSFGAIRLVAGAAMLAGLCIVLRGGLRLGGPARVSGVLSLLVYMYGFSLAYTALDAGLGALILFGMVQITMFAAALLTREALPALRWIGAGLALAGLAWLMWPGAGTAVSPWHGALMALAGIGWGVYSLAGRKSKDALQATAANFTLAAPVGLLAGSSCPARPKPRHFPATASSSRFSPAPSPRGWDMRSGTVSCPRSPPPSPPWPSSPCRSSRFWGHPPFGRVAHRADRALLCPRSGRCCAFHAAPPQFLTQGAVSGRAEGLSPYP